MALTFGGPARCLALEETRQWPQLFCTETSNIWRQIGRGLNCFVFFRMCFSSVGNRRKSVFWEFGTKSEIAVHDLQNSTHFDMCKKWSYFQSVDVAV